jgi:hypothetical protein
VNNNGLRRQHHLGRRRECWNAVIDETNAAALDDQPQKYETDAWTSGAVARRRRERVMTTACPTCGHPIPSDRAAACLVGRQLKLYEIVKSAGTKGIATPLVMAKLYDDDPAGGPESPNIIAVMAKHVNSHINAFGLAISGQAGPGSTYRLVALPECAGRHL